MSDASFDGKMVGFGASEPSSKFGQSQEGAENDQAERKLAASSTCAAVGGLDFGCRKLVQDSRSRS